MFPSGALRRKSQDSYVSEIRTRRCYTAHQHECRVTVNHQNAAIVAASGIAWAIVVGPVTSRQPFFARIAA
jgi:hypothetical protein